MNNQPMTLLETSGTETILTQATAGAETEPRLTWISADRYVLVWVSEASPDDIFSNGVIRTQVFDASGNPIGAEGQIGSGSPSLMNPAVAAVAGGGFVLVFDEPLRAQRFDADGQKVGSEIAISSLPADAPIGHYGASVAGLDGGGFAVSWTATANHPTEGREVRARVFDGEGIPVGDDFIVNQAIERHQHMSSITALEGGGFAVAWADETPQQQGLGSDIMIRIYNAAGTAVTNARMVDEGLPPVGFVFENASRVTAGAPVLATLEDGRIVAVWRDWDWTVKARILNQDGTAATPVLEVGDYAVDLGSSNLVPGAPTVSALAGGGFAVGWTSYQWTFPDPSPTGVEVRLYDSAGVAQGSSFAGSFNLNGAQSAPAILGHADGSILVAWVNGDATGTATDIRSHRFVLDDGVIVDIDLSVASISRIAPQDIHVGRLTADGAINAAFTYELLADSTGGAFRIEGDRLVVADTVRLATSGGTSISLQIRATDGNGNSRTETLLIPIEESSGPLLIPRGEIEMGSVGSADPQTIPQVTGLANDRFLLTWIELTADPYDVRGQIYANDGTPIGNVFTINSFLLYNQNDPDITPLSGGGFVAMWVTNNSNSSSGGDGSGFSAKGQIFDADGNRVGGEFRVNTTTAGTQNQPSAAAMESGGFAAVWSDASGVGGDSSLAGIKLQLFGALGEKIGGEVLVNATTHLPQTQPSIAQLGSGRLLVTWTDASASSGDTSFNAVRGRVLNADGSFASGEFLVNTTTLLHQMGPVVTALSGGGAVVIWRDTSEAQMLSTSSFQPADLRGQLFDSLGNPVGAEFVVNSDRYGPQGQGISASAGIAATPDGGFVVTWFSMGDISGVGDGEYGSVRAQRFAADGSKVGPEFLVNQSIVGLQDQPDVLVLPDGTLFFTWVDYGAVSMLYDIKGRFFEAVAVPEGGSEGPDTLNGTEGADEMAGKGGDDTYVINHAGDVVIEAENAGYDTILASVSHAVGAGQHVEVLTLTGTASIDATGNELANLLNGNAGNNSLDGGVGADTMTGGAGDDIYHVDNQADVVNEQTGGGTDTVRSSVTYELTAEVENLVLTGEAEINGTGNYLDNVITGNDAANFLDGQGGIDTLIGGGGNDTYWLGGVSETLVELAGGGTDTVLAPFSYTLPEHFEVLELVNFDHLSGTGNDADNILRGNVGNNVLNGGLGIDSMYGGAGDDTFIVEHIGDRAYENGFAGDDHVLSSVSFILGANIERLTLTGADHTTAVGNELANVLTGNNGNNTLAGGLGADEMAGGLGNDVYWVGEAGDGVIEGASAGTDRVDSSINYTLGAHVENLTLTGTAGSGTGNSLDNVITGNASVNTLSGGDGDDTLDGKAGADTMTGGLGNDIYVVDQAGDVASELAGQGTDTVRSAISWTLGANLEILTLTSGASVNATGNGLANVLNGNSGANVLDGAGGADSMFGGFGDDTYIVSDLGDKAFETSSTGGNDLVLSAISFQLGANIERLTLTGTGNTNAFGNDNSNTLIGNSGNNTLSGGGGIDILTGGGGHDIYYVDTTSDTVNELAGEGTDTVISSVSWTLAANLENLTLTGSAALNGTGNGLNNVITGNSGANSLNGGNGNDTLTGGLGADTLNGGSGDDTYVIDGSDTLVEFAGGGNDTVQTSQSYTLLAEFEYLTLTGSLNVNGTGNAANNVLNGNAGNNTLDGGAGADNMFGGLGNDTYVIDNSLDRAFETSANGGTDTVLSSVGFTLGANIENLTLTGSGNVAGIGNDLANVINGNAGDNSISGGLGADTLSGGAGNDTFLYGAVAHSTAAARDTILNFASGDKINLAQIDANATTTGTNDAFTFIGAGAFTNVAGQLRAYKSGTEWIAEGDTNGDGTADLVIGLTTANAAIIAADFVL